jgi:TatD DNase family protein
MIFDTHCHLQFPQYDNDREEMIARAIAKKINMICVGTDLETSKRAIELAHKHQRVWATVGLHPNDNIGETFDAGVYEKLLRMERVVAMGEIGLDYYRTTEDKDKDFQRVRFEQQLALAVKVNMPVIIHSRDAGKGSMGIVHNDLISILKNNLPPKLGVAHSFTGSIDEARKYLDLGFYLGFNGIVTFADQYDDLVKFVPMDRMLLETDAPFLAPATHRVQKGARNEPAFIVEVAQKLARLKGESYDTLIAQTKENTKKLFGM